MLYHILALGDVTSESGVRHLSRHLPAFKRLKNIAFTVVNGENVSGVGLTPEQVSEDEMVILARELAKRIENELEYPGQIKVHVLRETKVVEYAK